MYSGLVLTKYSGWLMGAHQKINRVARRHLTDLTGDISTFPSIRQIQRFEGTNGPDGIKRKSPSHNEPWHFLDPMDEENHEFTDILRIHHKALVKALKAKNAERSAFEAAWLSHAIVDGLTPAHHYPYEARIDELRVGGNEARKSVKDKVFFKGDNKRETLKNTYKVYGPKGLMTSHFAFEHGVSFLIKPLRLPDARPHPRDIKLLDDHGPVGLFMKHAREVASMKIYDSYLSKGWTPGLSSQIRHQLAPTIVKTVTLIWYDACREAGLCE